MGAVAVPPFVTVTDGVPVFASTLALAVMLGVAPVAPLGPVGPCGPTTDPRSTLVAILSPPNRDQMAVIIYLK